jgi:hypothetical protein
MQCCSLFEASEVPADVCFSDVVVVPGRRNEKMSFGALCAFQYRTIRLSTNRIQLFTMDYEQIVAPAKILTRREEIDSGIPWVEKYRPQRYEGDAPPL